VQASAVPNIPGYDDGHRTAAVKAGKIEMMSTTLHTGISWQKALPYLLVTGGVIGIVASFALTYDKVQLLQHAGYKPSCNLNPVLSCGSVMKTA